MKILLANKFYYRRGGDCIYTLNLEHLLKEKGHEVAIFSMQHSDNFKSKWDKYWPSEVSFKPGKGILNAFIRPFGAKEVAQKFGKMIDVFKPDIVHVGNIHSQISPIIVKISHQKGIKVVWSIHDYKLVCPRYDMLQNGRSICEECLNNQQAVIKHNCVKGSKIASILGYGETIKWPRHDITEWTDAFICASDFVKEIMLCGGFPKEKLYTIMHSIDTSRCNMETYASQAERDYYCFLGRLSHEKGIRTLIEAANQLPYKLIIIGDGPLYNEIQKMAANNVELVGFKDWKDIKKIISRTRFCVSPSEWYEVFGLVNIESLCLGSPILGANIGSIPYLIEQNVNGMTFTSGDVENLKEKIQKMWNSEFNYKTIAKQAVERYSNETYYKKLMEIYQG